jgi:hypothetical protein
MSELRQLKIYRMVNGERVPCVLTLDSTLLVVSEVVDMTAVKKIADGRADTPPPDQHKATTMARWVAHSFTDNPITGTDGMRATYFEELAALELKHAQQGSVCKPCERGRLIRKHREKLEELGLL